MTVIADCHDCPSAVILGERESVRGTTECPDCGSTSYSSEVADDDERDRVVEIAVSTPGIGKETAERIADRMVTVNRLRNARPEELRSIPGVGRKNGNALLDRVDEVV